MQMPRLRLAIGASHGAVRPATGCGALLAVAVAAALSTGAAQVRAQLGGNLDAHDPSTLVKDGSTYRFFATGQNISSKYSTNMTYWTPGNSVFSSPPAWTTAAVPGFTGFFWAPDIAFFDGEYHLYYSVSTWGSQVSAIGLVTNPTLNPSSPSYAWTDRGPVMQSAVGDPYNAIDAGILQDDNGRMWMTFGSYWNGIYVTELNPSTGMRLSPGTPPTRLASKPGTDVEASYMYKRGGFYYLFLNWGACCQGTLSTYNIRVGRGTSPTGPFFDKSGVNLVSGGGSLFLGTEGTFIGPGHMGIYSEGGQEWFSYHYYDGTRNGAPTYNLRQLYWDASGWPSATAINPNWTGAISSNWSSGTNWSSSLPNGVGHTANFAAITSGRFAVTLDGGAKTVGAINFDNATSYTIGANGGNSLILDATTGNAAITVISGSHTIAAPVTLNDNLSLTVTPSTSTLTMNGLLTASGRTINKAGAGTAQFENVRAAALNVNAGAVKISAKGSANEPGGTSVVNSLSIASDARLDLANNSMVIDYSGSPGTLEDDIRQHLSYGRLMSSAAGAPAGTRLGYGLSSTTGITNFAGQTVDGTSLLIKFTWAGDCNLDGQVDITDLGALATSWQSSGTWINGDLDYNGFINITDLGMLATNWQAGVGSPLGVSFEQALWAVGLGGVSVPEPAAVTLFMAGWVSGMRWRRCRQ